MADETTTTWSDLMREAKGPLVEALQFKTVLLSEIKKDKSPRRWNGKQVTVPIFTSLQQGTSSIGQTTPLAAPQVVDTEQAVINSAIVACAVSFSTQVMRQAQGDENVWAEVLPTKMERAEDAFGRVINEMMTGNGDALIAAVGAGTAAGGGGAGSVQNINVGTAANFYQLYVGRIVDVLNRTAGTPGARVTGSTGPVKITAVNFTTGVITVQHADGSPTAFATATTDGVFVAIESYATALQGLQQAVATSGIFEGINKSNVDAWKGTDVTPGTAAPLGIALLDKAERTVAQRSGRTPDFYLGDPAAIDKYSQGLTVQAQWAGAEGNLETGWTGVRYRNKLLVPDFDMPPNTVEGIQKSDMTIYTLDDGPDWDEHTGSMFQRFGTRALPLEAWLVWMLQLGFHSCNGFVKIGNLTPAT